MYLSFSSLNSYFDTPFVHRPWSVQAQCLFAGPICRRCVTRTCALVCVYAHVCDLHSNVKRRENGIERGGGEGGRERERKCVGEREWDSETERMRKRERERERERERRRMTQREKRDKEERERMCLCESERVRVREWEWRKRRRKREWKREKVSERMREKLFFLFSCTLTHAHFSVTWHALLK